MTSHTRRLSLAIVALLALSGCSAAGGTVEPAATSGGAIELAVSDTCAEGSDPQCISVNGEFILRPSAFERATVEVAGVAENGGQSAVDVTFTNDGATVVEALSAEAAGAGSSARLVLQIGGEIRWAPMVAESLTGNQITIAVSPTDDAQQIVDLLNGD